MIYQQGLKKVLVICADTYTNYISKDFIKDIVKPLHVEMLDFYNEYHSGDEGKLGCIEKIKTLLRAELYLPSLEKILDRY